MVKYILLTALAANAWGQAFMLNRFPSVGGAAAFDPTSIGGLALYWDYRDLTDGTVATWPDRIQNVAMAQATAGKRPTKSSLGVLFTLATDGNLNCTVQEAVTYSNVTVWVTFRLTALGSTWQNIFGDTANKAMFIDNANKGVLYPNAIAHFAPVISVYYNWVLLYTNISTAGQMRGYTNGVATVNGTGLTDRWRVSTMGNDAGPGYGEGLAGYIKFAAVWTNKHLTITDAQNINTWANLH